MGSSFGTQLLEIGANTRTFMIKVKRNKVRDPTIKHNWPVG